MNPHKECCTPMRAHAARRRPLGDKHRKKIVLLCDQKTLCSVRNERGEEVRGTSKNEATKVVFHNIFTHSFFFPKRDTFVCLAEFPPTSANKNNQKSNTEGFNPSFPTINMA
jgi:hypothetical protein